MKRVVGGCAVLSPALFSTASATFDYQNALDENVATYILVGIAVLYFTITVSLLLLTVLKSPSEKQSRRQDSHFHRSIGNKPQPPENSAMQPSADWASHRRVKRMKSDEEELIDGGPSSSQPSSPTDTTTSDMPTAATKVVLNETVPKLQRTPDPRRKKAPEQMKEQTSSNDYMTPPLSGPSRMPETVLPGTVSPLQRSPDMEKKPQMAGQSNQAKQGIAGDAKLEPIRRIPNQRLDSPRMQHRRKVAVAPMEMISITKAASHSPSITEAASHSPSITKAASHSPSITKAASHSPSITKATSHSPKPDSLTDLISALDSEIESPQTSKRTNLDTSFCVKNLGFQESEKVELLQLQRQLSPVARYWYEIGLQLDIPESTLTHIKGLKGNEKCMKKVCTEWLKIKSELTWAEVVAVLKTRELVRHTGEVAENIHKRFCQDPDPSPGKRSVNSKISVTEL